MKNLEATEIRGITVKQLTTYVIAMIGFIVALVIRDVRRENKMEELKTQIETIEKKIEAADKDRAALKIMDDRQNDRLTKNETIIDFMLQKNKQ